MEVHVHFNGIAPSNGEVLLRQIQHRVRLALDRFAHRVREVSVSLTDVNGPRGGLDQQCVLAITPMGAGEQVVARALEPTRIQAVVRSLKRARRRLKSTIERQRRR